MNPFMSVRSVMVTSLYVYRLVYILLQLFWFSLFIWDMHYTAEAVVCYIVLKVAVQCPFRTPMQLIVGVVKELTQAIS
jgi:hypothetical protein